MRIVAVTPFSTMKGGANRSFLMVLSQLSNTWQHEITVVIPEEGPICDKLDILGIPWICIPFHQICGLPNLKGKNLLRLLKFELFYGIDYLTAKKNAALIRQISPDIVYLNDVTPYFGAIIANELKLPYVWHFRSYVGETENYIMSAKKLFSNCKSIITISSCMEKLLKMNPMYPAEKIKMVLNGKPIEDVEKSKQTREMGFHIIECGRVSPEKGHKDAILAMHHIIENGITDIYLHIVGADPSNGKNGYVASLQTMIKKYSLYDNVFFEGQVHNMPEFRAKMNCELVCSIAEPFGLVTVEGMRSGLVVIGANTGGTLDIINDNKNGLLYEQGDSLSLAEKIMSVYASEDLTKRLSDTAYTYSHKHFTPEINAEQIHLILYNS